MPGSSRIPRTPVARRVAALAAAGVLALTACGGSDDGAGTADPTPTDSAAPTSSAAESSSEAPSSPSETEAETQTITATEMEFAIELESTDLPAGEYEIEVVNEGGMAHDMYVERDGEDVANTAPIDPGASQTLTVTLEPGEYVFYCSFGNHRAMGMEVTVTVT